MGKRKEKKLMKLCKRIDQDSWNQTVPKWAMGYFNEDKTEVSVELVGGILVLSLDYTSKITAKSKNPIMQKISKVYNPVAQLKRKQTIEYNTIGIYATISALVASVQIPGGDWSLIPKAILLGILLAKMSMHIITASGITKVIKGTA